MIRRCREAGFRIALGGLLPQPSSSATPEEIKEENREQRMASAAGSRTALNRDLILAKLSADPKLTVAELTHLRQKGRIRREGSTKAGRWVVLQAIQEAEQ